ncbi:tubulin-specific chaperone A-like [Dermatophagoides pteronyssinus]|uniref:Tubulin-specific chaperone A n=1 Tax=Dermatophagoides pteronyssinus TaxID=6956 RepID=A0A6P6XUR7_DERPT|nr:tubulin-specific chaperone A-like [Dermatophagoides pteronyssinus]
MSDPKINQIRIRTGVLKRSIKEKQSYEQELIRESERLNKMRELQKDEYEINKQQEIINETAMLLPDCQKRITAAYHDLQQLVEGMGEDYAENEIYLAAKALLQESSIP